MPPLISVAAVAAHSLGARIMFANGDDDAPLNIDLEDEATRALSAALNCTITLNGVPLSIAPSGFDRWWLSGTEVHSAPLDDDQAEE